MDPHTPPPPHNSLQDLHKCVAFLMLLLCSYIKLEYTFIFVALLKLNAMCKVDLLKGISKPGWMFCIGMCGYGADRLWMNWYLAVKMQVQMCVCLGYSHVAVSVCVCVCEGVVA